MSFGKGKPRPGFGKEVQGVTKFCLSFLIFYQYWQGRRSFKEFVIKDDSHVGPQGVDTWTDYQRDTWNQPLIKSHVSRDASLRKLKTEAEAKVSFDP